MLAVMTAALKEMRECCDALGGSDGFASFRHQIPQQPVQFRSCSCRVDGSAAALHRRTASNFASSQTTWCRFSKQLKRFLNVPKTKP